MMCHPFQAENPAPQDSFFYRKCIAFPIEESAPRGSHCGGTELVASRPAAGGESCGAGFYFYM